jgi:hypothetical protein
MIQKILNYLKKGSVKTPRTEAIDYTTILQSADISPVLADVGSSGTSHGIWDPIASESLVIGFDPDTRNPDENFGVGFSRKLLVNKAVSPRDDTDTVSFILTEYPSCSSMLEPDMDSLSSFSFRDYFRPVDRVNVAATSINRVMDTEELEEIHWLKLDSQGVDLRILKSIRSSYFNRLLAVDIEPGLVRAYQEEDMFTDCHAWLINHGFWMSRLEYQAYPKIRPETMADMAKWTGVDPQLMIRSLPKAPTAIEGRYLREVDWLDCSGQGKRALILAGVFGLLDGQKGYAYDVASLYVNRFGRDTGVEQLMEAAIGDIV